MEVFAALDLRIEKGNGIINNKNWGGFT